VSTGHAAAKGPPGRNMWWTRRSVALHLTILVLVPAFLALFFWQVQRVRQGNTLSWAYVFEWPFFIGYAIYMWWKLVHDQPGADPGQAGVRRGGRAAAAGAAPVVAMTSAVQEHPVTPSPRPTKDEEGAVAQDEELAAYNRYLAELHASGRRKRW